MTRVLYTFLLRLLSPLLLAWMGLRARRVGGQWEILGPKRFGYYRRTSPFGKAPIWVHAVSLGETRAAQPLIQALLSQGHTVLLTHLTYTGRAEGARVFAEAVAQGQLVQQWLPYDFPGACRRFIAHYQPSVAVIVEREVWPNLMHAAVQAKLPVLLVSARFSERSLRQSLRLGSIMHAAYSSFTAIYAQSLADAQRLEQAGGHAVRVAGNFKFDVQLPQDLVDHGCTCAQELGRKVVLIASTREGEEALFLPEIQRQVQREHQLGLEAHRRTLFYIVPRHPQRFDAVHQLLVNTGLVVCRRSALKNVGGEGCRSALDVLREADVLLGDSLGEMPWYVAQAQVVIMGGSFEPFGGHNFIEACALGKVVILGPHVRNFEQAVHDAVQAQAILRAPNAKAALRQALSLMESRSDHAHLSQAARYWVQKHQGSVQRVVAGINEQLIHNEK